MEIEYGKSCTVIKNVTMSEPCFLGHFPDEPIFPGTLIIEGMAQAGGFVFAEPEKKQKGVIAAVDKVKFLRQVIPGDTLYYKAELLSKLGNIAKVLVKVFVDEKLVARGEITYSFQEGTNLYNRA